MEYREMKPWEALRAAASILRENGWFLRKHGWVEGAGLLGRLADRLQTEARLDPTPYQSPCPPGYQTVIGWFAMRGLESADMGCRAGLWAWRQVHPQAIKVRAPEALLAVDVADWLLAYPVEWLDENAEALLMRRNGR